ncbi:carph-isopro domain-containing protein [Novosphingobium sp. RL4]|uniref:carph-isopro domain-containing protein n=1 Tax=Novosphingobium sp. RL4 TaxID=3109595 RepID=UPI003B636BB6
MQHQNTIFTMFGGIRPMARALGESPATVHGWKREGRIPAHKQPHVIAVGNSIGVPVTAEHVVFPLGHPAPDVAGSEPSVVCDENPKVQRKGRSQ